ncbi:MAG: secondary thiamine-phosphate synthase enzyme YjbQ [Candidatus Margulisbacteria bacterium]|nr:secondary thiamine-phosphate synthase enzyme YjbQ [Candidatus Margulisiibacteriota bacterium]MBU1021342.1 secondary thiamine-phosphate synthase enzyme YjbQ [Candidatus Margulisiibacteriota bacterium]MBU1729169.1 secondary thiamine-phosphate synthase enzyme YjbQ [Candidatus Margulisiibacteriota bacterium]MBU1954842.1 secondary thiamine-phosphate synthase enzyme YjbQ [Candidatus Margulisiibacteriota bacterium]
MVTKSKTIKLNTKGNDHVIDITADAAEFLKASKVKNGQLTVFIPGSTASVTTIEYEPGLIKDIVGLGDRLAPQGKRYAHDDTWGDGNGHAHLRASTIGPSLTVPVVSGSMTLGTWQQIVVIDHDNKARLRSVVLSLLGE